MRAIQSVLHLTTTHSLLLILHSLYVLLFFQLWSTSVRLYSTRAWIVDYGELALYCTMANVTLGINVIWIENSRLVRVAKPLVRIALIVAQVVPILYEETLLIGAIRYLLGDFSRLRKENKQGEVLRSLSLCCWFCQLAFLMFFELRLFLGSSRRQLTGKHAEPRICRDSASSWSRLTYSWIGFLFALTQNGYFVLSPLRTGVKRSFHHDGRFRKIISKLPLMPKRLSSYDNMFLPGCISWRRERTNQRNRDSLPHVCRLLKALAALDGGKEFLWVCIPLKIIQDILSIASHTTIHSVIYFLDNSSHYSTLPQILLAGAWACGINLAVRSSQAIVFQYYLYHLYTSSLKVSVAVKTLITNSVLSTPLSQQFDEINTDAKEKNGTSSAAQALSLLTIDADRCGESMIYLHNTWSHPIVIVLALIHLSRSIGFIPALVTFVALVGAIPLHTKSSALVTMAKKNAKIVMTRISDLSVALPVIRTVHAMSLEASLLERIKASRKEESRSACAVNQSESEAVVFNEIIMIFIYVICFGSYFLFSDGETSVAALLPAAASLSILRFPVWAAPNLITQVTNGYEAACRIDLFLSRMEVQQNECSAVSPPHEGTSEFGTSAPRPSIMCEGFDFYWCGGEKRTHSHRSAVPVLSNVHFIVQAGEFVVVKGLTGAGKTALLLSLLGELSPQQHKEVTTALSSQTRWCQGSVVYCAETPWIGDGTIREVVTMRRETFWPSAEAEAWYQTVIRACELCDDLKVMAHGDLTEVGSGGGTLSGGQRARVALARALFYRNGETDIFILDNVLSALDSELQRKIVKQVFNDLLICRGKTVVLSVGIFPPQLRCHRQFLVIGGTVLEEKYGDSISAPSIQFYTPIEAARLCYNSSDSSTSFPIASEEPAYASESDHQELSCREADEASPLQVLPKWKDLKSFLWVHFGPQQAITVLCITIARQMLYTVTENWMGIWFQAQHGWAKLFTGIGGCSDLTIFVITYSLLGCMTCAVSYWRSIVYYNCFRSAADQLQLAAVTRVFSVSPSFFDDAAVGDHIFQVLTKDQGIVDRLLPDTVKMVVSSTLQLCGVLTLNIIQFPFYIIVVPVLIPVFYFLNFRYLQLSKQLRVLESHAHEKCIRCLKNAVDGAVSLRAYGPSATQSVIKELCHSLDDATTITHVALTNDRWVALRLEFLSIFLLGIFQIIIVLSAVVQMVSPSSNHEEAWHKFQFQGSSALAGLGALSLMNSTQQLGQLCRCLGMLQDQFVSVERLNNLDQAAPTSSSSTRTVVLPSRNTKVSSDMVLVVEELSCRYRNDLPDVFASMSFHVRRGECLGIIGRSGNGKSSLFNALLRVMDVVNGHISIGERAKNVNLVSVDNLELSLLRRKYFHLVPQDPLLVKGTLRENLLLGSTKFSDMELLKVLANVGFTEALSFSDLSVLDFEVLEGGRNISAGQRQLVCVARALLYKPSVLLLDEFTAHIDATSERTLLEVIKRELQDGCAAILISHRREAVETLCERAMLIRFGSVPCELCGPGIASYFDSFQEP